MVNENNNNLIVKENYKKVEEVREIENGIPSFEEFMENYEKGDVNYDDLSCGDVGKVKGFGPCSGCSGSNNNLTFELEIILKNSRGGWSKRTVYNINDARSNASEIIRRKDFWDDSDKTEFSNKERNSLVDAINKAIEEHINSKKSINRTVNNSVVGDDPGGCSVIM